MAGAIHIGTSGWHYAHWKGPFYPPDLPSSGYLAHYLQFFQTVEINNSFYKLPSKETFQQWRQTVPPGFLFAVKANRYITHMKKLIDPEQPLTTMFERLEALEDHLGPVLYQLPPRFRLNLERLQQFLAALPAGPLAAFEFRDPSWFDPAVYATLAAHNAAFCIYHLNRSLSPREVTADFVYLRLHGPEGAYQGRYSDQELAGWAAAIRQWSEDGRDIYCYFDNDQAGYAVQDARQLQELVK